MNVGYVYDSVYLKHDTGFHIENASRLEAIMSHLERTSLIRQLTHIRPRPASIDEILLVHNKEHVACIQEVAQRGGGWLDPDTVMSSDSYEAAIYAAGGAIIATEAVMDNRVDSAFALVRPPGHHATPQRAIGFCLFNNIAIATKHAFQKYGLERIAIIDFDVHHGNGSQETFYDDPRVLYISTHEYPFYPGTGSREENGNGTAKGTTVNIPLPAGCGDTEYFRCYKDIVTPAVRRFGPQLIMVSAGYDLHWADSLALMQVSTSGITDIVRTIKVLAGELCDGRIVLCLEGGYHLEALACSVKSTFDVLLGNENIEDPLGQSGSMRTIDIAPLLQTIKAIHSLG